MAIDPPLRHPGIRYPPPLIYVAGFTIGWLIHRQWPLPLSGWSSGNREIFALLFIAVWLVLMLGAFATFLRAHTAIIPSRPAATLVTSGPYRFTRNPMYVSLAALYVGISVLFNSWWPLFLLPLVLVVVRYAVIAREERYLNDAFPTQYRAYCQRVRRWL